MAAILLCSLIIGAGSFFVSTTAWAAFVPVPGAQGPHLSLGSDPYPATFLAMSPGSVEHWQIQATLVDASAPLTLQFRRSGALVSNPRGLRVAVARCDGPWANVSTKPVCGLNEATVFGPAAASSLSESNHYDLAGITHKEGKYLLVTLSLADTPAARADKSLMGLTANIGFGLTATGVPPSAPPTATPQPTPTTLVAPPRGPSSLAFTGSQVTALLIVGLSALALGILTIVTRRKYRAGRSEARE
ncbi:MAG: permease of the major facilitator superfamily [Frondihabitans sp.]|nr:permease of the major facilitator superfamily [Frondihabitans sp.]